MEIALERTAAITGGGSPSRGPDLFTSASATDQAPDELDPDKFDWRSDDSIILGYQPATAVYRNACNAVVIRQEGAGYEDDQFVILRDAEAVRRLVAALQAEIRGGHG